MRTQSIWKNESGKLERDCDLQHSSEFLIQLIRENCRNIDDLKKIRAAVDCMIESVHHDMYRYHRHIDVKVEKTDCPSLRQLIAQKE